MALEAELLGDRLDTPSPTERRARAERRGPDRRKAGSRINPEAPQQSLMKVLGASGVVFSAATLVLTIVAGQMLDSSAPMGVIALEAAALITSILLLALGSIELRLIEIRLELMMMNGGRRGIDRRSEARRN